MKDEDTLGNSTEENEKRAGKYFLMSSSGTPQANLVPPQMDIFSLLQWPAMAVTLIAAWLTASQTKTRREKGFWWFIASNVLWIAWGIPEGSWALVALQVGLAALNIRGVAKNERK